MVDVRDYKDLFGNIKRGKDGLYTIFSRKYPMNNIYDDGNNLFAGVYNLETLRAKGYFLKKITTLGAEVTQEGDTEVVFRFPSRSLVPIARLIGIYPKRNRDKSTYNFK